ncbi:Uncharacterised protein [Bordetella pertussis]|nr:Uncharacterised protein [Bordetella pertussis]CPO32278.1 Uncharacterised protein [Bordetella pertussis]
MNSEKQPMTCPPVPKMGVEMPAAPSIFSPRVLTE